MTISSAVARFLAEEHKYIPFPKEVHLLGRQTIQLDMGQAHAIFEAVGVPPREVTVEFDTTTRQANDRDNLGMSDTTFFKMFGVESVRAIDHSDFEGADIVFDLTRKLPKEHESCADLIFDGSVMDNLFDPSSAMHNVIGLLKPGGRYIGVNAGTTKWLPAYVAFNPYWFFDFFTANHFRDVKVYVVDFGDDYKPTASRVDGSVYLLDAKANHREIHNYQVSNGPIALLIIAEKDVDSTMDGRTSQGCYRLPDEWDIFDANVARIIKSKRPIVSLQKQANFRDGGRGFSYVGILGGDGLSTHNPLEQYPVLERGELNLGSAFAGYDWGAAEAYEGLSWRWIDDCRDESVILLNLVPNQAYTIEAKIHTCRDQSSINALRGFCDGKQIVDQEIQSNSGEHKLIMKIPAMVTKEDHYQIRLGFSAKGADHSTETVGRNVALSSIRFYPAKKVQLGQIPIVQNLFPRGIPWRHQIEGVSGWKLLEEVRSRAFNRVRQKFGF